MTTGRRHTRCLMRIIPLIDVGRFISNHRVRPLGSTNTLEPSRTPTTLESIPIRVTLDLAHHPTYRATGHFFFRNPRHYYCPTQAAQIGLSTICGAGCHHVIQCLGRSERIAA